MYKMFDKIKNKRSISSSNPIVSNPVAAQSSSSESRDTLSKDGTMKTGATKSISLHYTSSSFSTNNNTQVVTWDIWFCFAVSKFRSFDLDQENKRDWVEI